jgi:hypothetical protein
VIETLSRVGRHGFQAVQPNEDRKNRTEQEDETGQTVDVESELYTKDRSDSLRDCGRTGNYKKPYCYDQSEYETQEIEFSS